MDITLEKIELVKDRTGVTYKEAKEALEATDGSVVDAIIAIEEKINSEYDSQDAKSFKDSELYKKIKEVIAKGNMSRIIIKKDGEIVVNFPLTASVIGAILVPWGVVFGIIATIGFQCDVEFVNNKGEVVDVNGKVIGLYSVAKDATMRVADKSQEVLTKVMESEKTEKFADWVYDQSDKLADASEKASDKFSNFVDKAADKLADASERAKDKYEEFEASNSKFAEATKKAEDFVEKVAKKGAEIADKADEKLEDVLDVDFDVDIDVEDIEDEVSGDEDQAK